MGLTLVTPPSADPVSLEDAKTHLRVYDTSEDALIEGYITAATRNIEKSLGISLMERTYRLSLDSFSDAIELPRGPVSAVNSVQYVGEDGETYTLAADYYSVDLISDKQWVVLNSGYSWPALLDAVNTVAVEYVAGFETLPAEFTDLRHAILLLVSHFFQTRSAVAVGVTVAEVPMAVTALTDPYRGPGL